MAAEGARADEGMAEAKKGKIIVKMQVFPPHRAALCNMIHLNGHNSAVMSLTLALKCCTIHPCSALIY